MKTILLAGIIAAGMLQAQDSPPKNAIPVLGFGTVIGRAGAAWGEGFIFEVNPISRVELYGFVDCSNVNGYSAQDGIKANYADTTKGGGSALRVAHFRDFHFSVFGQIATSHSRAVAHYPDGYGGMVEYIDDENNLVYTVGVQVEHPIKKGPIWMFGRVGENLGRSVAATTADGVSFDFGFILNGKTVARGVGNGVRKFFH